MQNRALACGLSKVVADCFRRIGTKHKTVILQVCKKRLQNLLTFRASPVKVIKWPKKLEKLRISVPSASMFLG